jgi:hypothetical protein
MTVTIDLGQVISLAASLIAIVGGVVGFARFIKWWWKRPLDPTNEA